MKEQFGTRAKLIDAVLVTEARTKDEGYKSRLAGWPVPRLYDHYKGAKRREANAAKAAKAAKPAPAKAAKAPKTAKPAKKA